MCENFEMEVLLSGDFKSQITKFNGEYGREVKFIIVQSSHCKRSLLSLIREMIGPWRLTPQEKDHSGSRSHSFPSFLCLNSGMSPERVWSESGLVGSEKIHLVVIKRSKGDFPSY